MEAKAKKTTGKWILESKHFDPFIKELEKNGFQVVGPTVRDGAIVYDELRSVSDLPAGWADEQEKGTYRLFRRKDNAYFGYAVGPHSWKKFLHPAKIRLFSAERKNQHFEIQPEHNPPLPYAFLGVRPCELAAIRIQDRVFLGGRFQDPIYQSRRKPAFIVAVNCTEPGGTCFCASMQTGPSATNGFDLLLTEIVEAKRHYFVVEIGSERGRKILAAIPHKTAGATDVKIVERLMLQAKKRMKRRMNTAGLKELLYKNYEHPHWEEVAGRCLSCANCTMVCPTCFCTTVEDTTDVSTLHAERWRKWDSCFSTDFSFIYGGNVRQSVKSRYRQWLTHKLAAWVDQFGTSGCVGCGRCITWCPVGIDLTEEVKMLGHNKTKKRM